MRNTILPLALTLLCAAPSSAQIMGSINSSYPTVRQAVETTTGNKMEVRYAAINFGQGSFLEMAGNERFRKSVNDAAAQQPIGSLEISKGIMLGEEELEAGKYTLAFKIDEDGQWNMALKIGEDEYMMPLELEKAAEQRARLTISLVPSADGAACSLIINFGKQACFFEGGTAG